MSNGIIDKDKTSGNINDIRSKFPSLAIPSESTLPSAVKADRNSLFNNKFKIRECAKYKNVIKVIKATEALSAIEKYPNFLSTNKLKIKEYFELKLSIRVQRRNEYANYIKSADGVFEVLKLGNSKGIPEAYDGAVDILAECNKDVMIKAIELACDRHISDTTNEVAQSWEQNWEILIKGLVCSENIESHQKMALILSLCNPRYKLSKLIKLTLIDAIVDLDLDVDLAAVMLQIFLSQRESDNFVRKYAQEAIESL